ncbi:hypothetical protein [Geotalea uraniireducens]|uniref:Uncharacterized protein n=1 Tax=Geotalea uraniireducens (strain Rf4) TaxID=351605 RepID=A5GBR9_GEOUR|nr:hypothetical protein [Geotalea uraniireducens]ABQ24972.1 hypothetical protein Gura_0763 [Geotalea uraniireducens Rf4]
MTTNISKYLLLTLTLLTLAACGGGGGGGTTDTTKTTATVKIALSGTLPAGTAIAGAALTLTLPDNVIPELVNGAVAGSVVTPSGVFAGGALVPVVYKEATASSPGMVVIALASAATTGVAETGEVATVTLRLTNSAAPTAGSFTLDQKVTDTSGKVVSGLSAIVSGVTLQ